MPSVGSCTRFEAGDGEAAYGDADRGAQGQLEDEQAGHVGEPVARLLDPFDEADHEQQRHRVVHPRLPLERAGQALFQGRAAQHGEDRRRVGGGDRRADQHPFQGAEVEDPLRGQAGNDGGHRGADRRQRGRRAEHRPDLRPAGGQAALEEDQHEGDRTQRAGQLGVVELDPADALRAGQHAQPEEEQQPRDANAVGEQRADDARGEQGPGDEDQLGVVSTHRLDPTCSRRRRRGAARAPPASRAPARPRGARAGGGRPGRAGRAGRRR